MRIHINVCVRVCVCKKKFIVNFAPQVLLFVAQFISGIGGSLYYTLGVSYMDDNTKKSKTPALLSKLEKTQSGIFLIQLTQNYDAHLIIWET